MELIKIMDPSKLAPPKAANLLLKASELFIEAHGGDKFPVDIDIIAKGAAELFNWKDPITDIKAVNLPNFEGMLATNDSKSKWMIAYNESLSSQGRIRFTKAHELGHYMMHRNMQTQFMCSKDDMLKFTDEKNIEAEADKFASHLLMPIDDFRVQMNGEVNFDSLGHCADRYGVSLTAAVIKWLSYTEEKAVLIVSRDGFMDWAISSTPAKKSGAYFKTKNNVIEIPEKSLALKEHSVKDKLGENIATKIWFPSADSNANLKEFKVHSEQYDCTLTLLILPKHIDCWANRKY